MRKRLYLLPFLFLVLFLGISCETVSDEPVFDLSPKIELLDISSDTILQFQDNLMVQFSYEDGDGDLGNADPDINSIFVKDARLEREEGYYVAPIAPVGAEISIRGSLNLILEKTFILGNAAQEKTTFSIYLVDQAGNQSNTIETGPITIIKD